MNTSHEHLDVFKIINMNARLYDPVIGRFFSPDPVIQDFEATQSLNRYSYCQNNPVNRVDLDGRLDDDYFNQYGEYLYTDTKSTSNIKIINQSDWDRIKKEHRDEIGDKSNSYFNLLRDLTINSRNVTNKENTNTAMNIFNHYYQEAGYNLDELVNNTIDPEPNKSVYEQWYSNALADIGYGKDFKIQKGKFVISVASYELGVNLKSKYDIISTFIHEREGHGKDFIKNEILGITPLYSEDRDGASWEKRACLVQMRHISWSKTSPEFKAHMMKTYPQYIH